MLNCQKPTVSPQDHRKQDKTPFETSKTTYVQQNSPHHAITYKTTACGKPTFKPKTDPTMLKWYDNC
eukprot:gnl/Chilomastix_caulleri/1903.p3 GENE.gnl/Chilomastix_caulleri/1903~~gnl/Chilomastix_caulleri/1903.p3  ORF type:complete len:67 (+),score=6.53 gnl/Chilomastix_caulleri/1903:192-392(+)